MYVRVSVCVCLCECVGGLVDVYSHEPLCRGMYSNARIRCGDALYVSECVYVCVCVWLGGCVCVYTW